MHDRDYKYDLPGDKLITFNYNLTMKLILLVCATLAVVSGMRMEKRAPPICKAGDTVCSPRCISNGRSCEGVGVLPPSEVVEEVEKKLNWRRCPAGQHWCWARCFDGQAC